MNYLAHAYLSFSRPQVLVGNMISDFIKGKKQYDYPTQVQVGIRLHRAIDAFTDAHEATAALKNFFRPAYRLYAGAFADVTYDYFLANDRAAFPDEVALFAFSQETYDLLLQEKENHDAVLSRMLPYMQQQNWLYNYRLPSGIEKSFEGVRRRSTYIEETNTAFLLFEKHRSEMQLCYDVFFPDVKKYALETLDHLVKTV